MPDENGKETLDEKIRKLDKLKRQAKELTAKRAPGRSRLVKALSGDGKPPAMTDLEYVQFLNRDGDAKIIALLAELEGETK